MKLSDYKNEDALDLLADLLDPVSELMADAELQKVAMQGDKMTIAKYVLKNKNALLITIFARMNGTPREEYSATITEMLAQLLDVLNDKTLVDFFALQAQKKTGASFGLAMENITATDEA